MIWPFNTITLLRASCTRLLDRVASLERSEARLRKDNTELHIRLRAVQAQLREATKMQPPRTAVRPFPFVSKEEVARKHVENFRQKVAQAQADMDNLPPLIQEQDANLMDSMIGPLENSVIRAMHEGES